MALTRTESALLAALALQPLLQPAFAQNAPSAHSVPDQSAGGPANHSTLLADNTPLPEITVNGEKAGKDFSAGVSSVGAKIAVPLRDLPQSATVVNRALMESQGVASLQEALRNVPGITIGGAEGGQIGNNINLRGFTARTDIYLDGARDRGQYYRDTYYLESVEVLKGPSSMLFGRGSTGGIINQARKQPLLKGQDEVTASVSTDGSVRSTIDVDRALSDTAAFRIEAMAQDARTTRDVMRNQDFGIAPSLRLGIGTPTEITLSALIAHNHDMPDYGINAVNGRPIDVPRNTFYGLTDDRTLQDVGIFSARIEHKFSPALTLRNQTQYSNYRTDARESAPNSVGTLLGSVFTPLPTAATGNFTNLPLSSLALRLASHDRVIRDQSLDNQTDLIAKFATGAVNHTLIAGAEISRDLYDNQATSRTNLPILPVFNPPYADTPASSATVPGNLGKGEATSIGVYVNDTLELSPQWKVMGGLRYDRFKASVSNTISTAAPPIYNADQNVGYTSVRGGVIYQPSTAQSYYVSYGTSFNPSLEQLTVTSGQQNTPPETTKSYEIGAKWDLMGDRLSLTSALFDIEKSNARTLIAPGDYALDGDVRVTGVEVGASGKLTHDWQIMTGYTHLNPVVVKASALDGTQGKVLANTPRDSATMWSTYNLSKSWEIGGGFTAMSQRFASNTDVVAAPGYVRWDATLAYHQPRYDVRLNLLNLSNREYIDALIPSDGGRSVPGAGRAALLTVAYRF